MIYLAYFIVGISFLMWAMAFMPVMKKSSLRMIKLKIKSWIWIYRKAELGARKHPSSKAWRKWRAFWVWLINVGRKVETWREQR